MLFGIGEGVIFTKVLVSFYSHEPYFAICSFVSVFVCFFGY